MRDRITLDARDDRLHVYHGDLSTGEMQLRVVLKMGITGRRNIAVIVGIHCDNKIKRDRKYDENERKGKGLSMTR